MRVSSSGGGVFRGFFRLLALLCILAVIFMITGLLMVRTQGGHDFVTGRLEALLGEKVELQRVRIGWPYELVMEKVSTQGMEQQRAGFKALELRVAPAWPGRLRVRVHRGVVNIVRQQDGTWRPAAFSRLADLPFRSVSALSEQTETLRRRVMLELTDCSLYWLESAGQTVAGAQGVAFDMRPVNMPGGEYYHYRLSVYNMTDPSAGQFYDMEREWLASDTQPYVELSRSSRRIPTAEGGFWEVGK